MSWRFKLIESKKIIEAALKEGVNPCVAYSGGKDAIVTAHLLAQYGITSAIGDLTFYFPKQAEDARRYAKEQSLDVTYVETIDWETLKRYPEAYFPQDLKKNKYLGIKLRQWRSIPMGVKQKETNMVFYGRRIGENNAPKDMQFMSKHKFWAVYPIRKWTTLEVWEYMRDHKLRIPWIYRTKFSRYLNNAPWITLIGSRTWCWQLVYETDPSVVEEAARQGLQDAKDFLKLAPNDPARFTNALGKSWFVNESSTINPHEVYGIPTPVI